MDPLFPTTEASPESSRKKRRLSSETTKDKKPEIDLKRWKTNRVQQIYFSKLVKALHRVRQRSNDGNKVNDTAKEIRETADRVLAVSARGTTRWSRAIVKRDKMKKQSKPKLTGNCKPRKSINEMKRIKLPAVQRKLKMLSRLVPGCRKVSVPNLLDEATDYIAALEMQVRAMEALAELLATAAPRTGA